jgi:adenosylcobyric acid synthase
MKTQPGQNARAIAVFGTGSDVGKSMMVAGLCRLFHRAGVCVAPFKAQNMSLNAFVTMEGGEIGRAQALQAQAAGIPPHVDMNPILLKPESDDLSQVIVQGRILMKTNAHNYFERTPDLFHYVQDSYERLAQIYEVMVIEGAGSAAEVNLRDRDIVNWRVAEMADASVLLVANIDLGGVFAQVVGTLDLISPAERRRVRGILINKFRGDRTLFAEGVAFLKKRTGVPILGVLPFLRGLELDQEDSLEVDRTCNRFTKERLNVAVLLVPRMSNFTDFNALAAEPDVTLRYIRAPDDLCGADVVILPGSKNTIGDLEYLRGTGFLTGLQAHVEQGGELIGVCGGYQMLGIRISDPHTVEVGGSAEGFGFLNVETELTTSKTTRQVRAIFLDRGSKTDLVVTGYYVHVGKTRRIDGLARFKLAPLSHGDHGVMKADHDETGDEDGTVHPNGLVWGTYIHGLFDGPEFRRYWLNSVRLRKGFPPLDPCVSVETNTRLATQLDRWADHVKQYVDWPSIAKMVGLSLS